MAQHINIATQYYFIRVNQGDIHTAEEVNAIVQGLPHLDAAVLCSERGKTTYRRHWHVLIRFDIPMAIGMDVWRQWFGERVDFRARNPNSNQPLTIYLEKVINYIKDDGDWWEISAEEGLVN